MNIVEFPAGRLAIATFAERPELRAGVFEAEIQSAVPEFMRHDPTAALYYDDSNLDRYCEYGLVAVDPAEPDRPVARAFSVPFAFPDPARGREALPDGGWDQVIRWAHRDRLAGRPAHRCQRARNHGGSEAATPRHISGDAQSVAQQRASARLYHALCANPSDRQASRTANPFRRIRSPSPYGWAAVQFLGAYPSPPRRHKAESGAVQHGNCRHPGRMAGIDGLLFKRGAVWPLFPAP